MKYSQISSSVAVIGGADGPTSIFLAGKTGSTGTSGIVVIAGIFLALILCIMVGIIIYYVKKKRD